MKSLYFFFSFVLIIISFQSCSDDCDQVNCNAGVLDELNCQCDCPPGFTGMHCEHEDLCITQNVDCQNGGTCVDGTCQCPEGYAGINCEHFDSTKVQFLLDTGFRPIELYNGGISMDSLYGKMYEGGLLFYLNTDDGSGMVAAPVDQSDGARWGCQNDWFPGADGLEIGTGLQNTLDILDWCKDDGIAAKLCYDLKLNGKDDWFLPSQDELLLIWSNLADTDKKW